MDPTLLQLLTQKLQGHSGADMRAMLMQRLLEQGHDAQDEADTSTTAEIEALQRQVHRLSRDLAQSVELVRYIGRTFGACGACWGTRPDCPSCHGQGGPGTYSIDHQEAMRWMAPSCRQMGFRLVPQPYDSGRTKRATANAPPRAPVAED